MRQYKAVKTTTMGIDDRSVTGVFAVHGNVDSGDGFTRDRSHPGVFGDYAVDGRKRAVFLWQHNSMEPPTATIDSLFEIGAADLPPAVKLYAPDASGATGITRTYLDTPRGNEVLAALKAGALHEMSYSYDVTRYDIEDSDAGGPPIRNIYEADLFDISDVNWGMNPATSADGTKVRPLVDHGAELKGQIAAYHTRVRALLNERAKAGRVFSAANYAALEGVAGSLKELSDELKNLLAAAEPKDRHDARRLLLEVQRTLARINGVNV